MEKEGPSEPVVLTDPTGVDVTLSEERWRHIVNGYPEMSPHRADLRQTIEQPEVVYERAQDRYYFRRVVRADLGACFYMLE